MQEEKERRVLRLAPQNAPGQTRCDLTVDTVDFFQDYFLSEMARTPEGEVVLDLQSISQIDSMGVGLVVGMFKECKALGRAFSVETGIEEVLQVFRMLNLDRVFPIRNIPS